MALPITPTPTLTGKDADNFLKRVQEQENTPVGLVPTPKLKLAMKQILREMRELELEILKAKTKLIIGEE